MANYFVTHPNVFTVNVNKIFSFLKVAIHSQINQNWKSKNVKFPEDK